MSRGKRYLKPQPQQDQIAAWKAAVNEVRKQQRRQRHRPRDGLPSIRVGMVRASRGRSPVAGGQYDQKLIGPGEAVTCRGTPASGEKE